MDFLTQFALIAMCIDLDRPIQELLEICTNDNKIKRKAKKKYRYQIRDIFSFLTIDILWKK